MNLFVPAAKRAAALAVILTALATGAAAPASGQGSAAGQAEVEREIERIVREYLLKNPEIIVDMTHGDAPTQAEVQAIQKLWARFPSIDAVGRERVYIVTQKLFVVPGPRVVEAVRALYELIHFGERP